MEQQHEQRLIFSSPQRANQTVLKECRKNKRMDNVIALMIQMQLHTVFNDPRYFDICECIRSQLRRMQGLAFDGYYPSEHERYALLDIISNGQSDSIHRSLTRKLEYIERHIEQNQLHMDYKGDHLRMHQDLDAIIKFAEYFRGRLLFFGSARKLKGSPEYDATHWLSQTLVEHLADEKCNTEQILTGGGPGVMEAANEGAMHARFNLLKKYGGLNAIKSGSSDHAKIINTIRMAFVSIGLRIELPFETGWNPYLQAMLSIKTFPNRKFGMNMSASGRCVTDGKTSVNHGRHPAIFSLTPGFGTADENWEAICAMQCGKMPKIPFITIGEAASHIMMSASARMENSGTIDPTDKELIIPASNEVEGLKKYLQYYEIEPTMELKKIIDSRNPVMS